MRKLLACLLLLAPVWAWASVNTVAQNIATTNYSAAATTSATFSTMTNPSLVVIILTQDTGTPTGVACSDNKNAGNYTIDSHLTNSITDTGGVYIASKQNTQTAAATVTCNWTNNSYGKLKILEITGAATSSALDAQNTAFSNLGVPSVSVTTASANDTVVAAIVSSYAEAPPDSGYTTLINNVAVQFLFHSAEYNANSGSAGPITLTLGGTHDVSGPQYMMAVAAYKTITPPAGTTTGGSVPLQFP